jgi:hypothetical protein
MFLRIVISFSTDLKEFSSRYKNSSLIILMATRLLGFCKLLPRYTFEVVPSPNDLIISYWPLKIGCLRIYYYYYCYMLLCLSALVCVCVLV